MVDSAMFYITGTLYPLVARATYPALGFPPYPGEVAASDATVEAKEAARLAAQQALQEPLAAIAGFFIGAQRFIGARVLDFDGDFVCPGVARHEAAGNAHLRRDRRLRADHRPRVSKAG